MTEPEFLKSTIVAISLLLNFVGLVFLTYNRISGKAESRRIANDPLHVQKATEFVTAEHCQLLHRNFESRLINLEKNVALLFQQQRESYDKFMESMGHANERIHERIDEVAQSVAHIEGTIEPLKNLAAKFSQDVGRLEGILQRHR